MESLYAATADPSKKRKSDEINGGGDLPPPQHPRHLTPAVIRAVLEPLTKDQLLDILQSAAVSHPSVLAAVRSAADPDPAKRKLFVRGLGPDTSSESLRAAFSPFGDLDEAVAVVDKATGKPRGFGFVVFRHVDGALVALQEPSKKIDGRMTVSQLAAAGNGGATADVSSRKVYVGNIPSEVSADRLLAHFMSYGDVEEGPLGFDNQIGKPKRFAFFIYKTDEGARASLVDPIKAIDGQQIICKLAVDGKKGRPNEGDVGTGPNGPPPNPVPGSVNSGFGTMNPSNPYLNSGAPPAGGGPGFQPPPLYGGGYGAGFGGYGGSQYGGPGSREFGGGLSNAGSMYRPPSSVGMPSGGYLEGGNYGSGYPSQMNQPPSGPRVPPPGGMYPGMPPPYY